MNPYVISCCSTADLSEEHFRNRNISYVCFHFELDGVEYPDDLGKSIPFDEFYRRMANGASTKTSQINVEEFTEYFEPFLKEGKISFMYPFPPVFPVSLTPHPSPAIY